MDKFVIHHEIPYRKGHASNKDLQLHAKFLQVLTTSFDKTELHIYHNRNQHIQDFDQEKWLDEAYSDSHFNHSVNKAQRKTLVAHCIRAKKPILTLKGDPSVNAFLKQTNTFLCAHFWNKGKLAIKDIGFLISYVPSKHSNSIVTKDMIERTGIILDLEWAKVPQFKLIYATPKVRLSGKQKPLNTQAYSVQVLAKEGNC
jgi:hypothetical protein